MEGFVRQSIRLSPGEGAWRHLLGWTLQDQRGQRGPPAAEEVRALRDGFELRPGPDTMTRCGKPRSSSAVSQKNLKPAL